LQALFVGFRRQHPVDAEVSAELSQKGHIVELQQPSAVVNSQPDVTIDREVTVNLCFDFLGVLGYLFECEHSAQFRSAARVAYHSRPVSDDGDGPMARALQIRQRHEGNQISYVQAIGGGVKTDIGGDLCCLEQVSNGFFVGDLLYEAAFLQNV
jgi:hypothetical protein